MNVRACICAIALLTLATVSVAEDQAGDSSRGKTLYTIYCTQCHGVGGDGKGINVRDMAVQPRDHTDRGEMSSRTDDDLRKAIKHGGKAVNKSMLMPAWGNNLSDTDINDVIAYLREICCAP